MATVLSLASCSSDEPVNNVLGDQTVGEELTFSASRAEDAAKKTYYGTPNGSSIPVYWSNYDQIMVYSPAVANEKAQVAIYNTVAIGDGRSTATFTYSDGETQAIAVPGGDGLKRAIRANAAGKQDFYAYYPSDTDVDVNGVATYTIPSDQTQEARKVAAADAGEDVSPYAASIAVIKGKQVLGLESIDLMFYDIMNVLRLTVKNSNNYTINGITVTSADVSRQYVSGEVKVTPSGNATFTTAVSATDETNSKKVVGVSASAQRATPTQVFNFYLMPQDYSGITITVEYNDGVEDKKWEGTTKAFLEGTFKDVEVTILESEDALPEEPTNAVFMGIMVKSIPFGTGGATTTQVIGKYDNSLAWMVNAAGKVTSIHTKTTSTTAATVLEGAKPLFFADGNMHIPYNASQLSSGGKGYIDHISFETANVLEKSGYGYDTKSYGLFMWGDPDATGTPQFMNNSEIHISGNPTYDIARKQLGGKWRLPTAIEWAFLIEEIATKGKHATSVNRQFWSDAGHTGYDMETNNKLTVAVSPWQEVSKKYGYLIESSVVDRSIFLPAVDIRYENNAPNNRTYNGYYWSGSWYDNGGHSTQYVAHSRNFFFNNVRRWAVDYVSRRAAMAIRPVME